jgi:Ca2+-binding EF-hand superfamily protein
MLRYSLVRFAIIAISGCFLLSTAVVAADKADGKRDPEKMFKKKDADGNGSLSLEEFKTGMPEKALPKADARFKKLDTNGDGQLSLDEFKAGMGKKPQ